MTQRPHLLPVVIGAAVIVALDQWTKYLVTTSLVLYEEVTVLPVLSWVLLHNEGVAFSMFDDVGALLRWGVSALAIALSGYLLYDLRNVHRGEWQLALAYTLVIGGAVGNLIDRARQGYVVDFVLVHWDEWRFAVFNVADAAISVGAVVWIGVLIFGFGQRDDASTERSP